MNDHPIITPASPLLASPIFDASFDSIESLTTSFAASVVPTLETTTVTEVALGYHRNGQYSITAMTTSRGAVAERYAYTAYGQPRMLNAIETVLTSSAVGNRYTYTGREWDETLILHHFRARWMSPLAGRFLGRDPIGYEDSYNAYTMLVSCPLNKSDPTGSVSIDCDCSCRKPRSGQVEGYNVKFSVSVNCSLSGGADACCKSACKSEGRNRGIPWADTWCGSDGWKLTDAQPDDLGLEGLADEVVDSVGNTVCTIFLVCEVVVPTPGKEVACAAGTKVVCRTIKHYFRMKGKGPRPPKQPPSKPPKGPEKPDRGDDRAICEAICYNNYQDCLGTDTQDGDYGLRCGHCWGKCRGNCKENPKDRNPWKSFMLGTDCRY